MAILRATCFAGINLCLPMYVCKYLRLCVQMVAPVACSVTGR